MAAAEAAPMELEAVVGTGAKMAAAVPRAEVMEAMEERSDSWIVRVAGVTAAERGKERASILAAANGPLN